MVEARFMCHEKSDLEKLLLIGKEEFDSTGTVEVYDQTGLTVYVITFALTFSQRRKFFVIYDETEFEGVVAINDREAARQSPEAQDN